MFVQRTTPKQVSGQFGKCLRLGAHEDSNNRAKVAERMREHAARPDGEAISPKEYVDRMKEGRGDVCYVAGESIEAASSPTALEKLRLVIIYMTDPIGEYGAQQRKALDGKELKSATKEGLYLEDEDEREKLEELKAEFELLA